MCTTRGHTSNPRIVERQFVEAQNVTSLWPVAFIDKSYQLYGLACSIQTPACPGKNYPPLFRTIFGSFCSTFIGSASKRRTSSQFPYLRLAPLSRATFPPFPLGHLRDTYRQVSDHTKIDFGRRSLRSTDHLLSFSINWCQCGPGATHRRPVAPVTFYFGRRSAQHRPATAVTPRIVRDLLWASYKRSSQRICLRSSCSPLLIPCYLEKSLLKPHRY